jgi:uncharacterized protein YndB with AHSA1/START domain
MSAHNARISSMQSSEWDLVMTRTFDAPRELVFKAWTDTKHMARWWGPNGFTNPVCELDARVGGAMRIDMRAPNGVVYPMNGVFKEIEEPERLVFISSALDDQGNAMFDVLNTVTFVEQKGKTALTLQARVIKATAQAPQYLQGMQAGWTQSLDRLAAHLDSLTEGSGGAQSGEKAFELTRVFDAPRELVFKAWTDAGALARWWGPKGCTIAVHNLELRPGGVFHYSMQLPNGQKMFGKFVYREIAPPERIVFVNSFSDEKGGTTRSPYDPKWPLEILNTLALTEREGKTTLTLRGGPINATEEERKIFESFREAMQKGFGGTFDQLDEYLAKA